MPSPRITVNQPNALTVRGDTQDALLIRLGCPLVAFDELGRPVLDPSGQPRIRRPSREAIEWAGGSLADIGGMYLRRVGPERLKLDLYQMGNPQTVNLLMSRSALRRYFPGIPQTNRVMLGQARGDFPDLLADTLNKSVLSHYALARRSWRAWARRGTVVDFKQADRIRIEDAPALEKLLPGQKIEFGALPENPREQLALATYARGLRFTRQAMINDDTETLRGIGEVLAQGAYRLEDALAYAVLADNAAMADGTALFHADHANLTTGTLSAASLGAACARITGRRNAHGDVLDLSPARLLVPSTLKATGEQVLDSMSGAARHETEGRLELVSSAHLDANSVTQWYVTTDPQRQAPVEVAFLEGADAPRVDSASAFSTDGLLFKVRHDVAAKAIDHRAIVRSSGVDA